MCLTETHRASYGLYSRVYNQSSCPLPIFFTVWLLLEPTGRSYCGGQVVKLSLSWATKCKNRGCTKDIRLRPWRQRWTPARPRSGVHKLTLLVVGSLRRAHLAVCGMSVWTEPQWCYKSASYSNSRKVLKARTTSTTFGVYIVHLVCYPMYWSPTISTHHMFPQYFQTKGGRKQSRWCQTDVYIMA